MIGTDIWAVVPVKEFHLAKTRLAPALSADQRHHLSAVMLRDVLTALRATPGLAGIRVVTRDPGAVRIAVEFGADVVPGPTVAGPTPAVAAAMRGLADEGRHGMLAIMGDLPLVTPGELARFLNAHGTSPTVSLAPARDGRGCNMALATPADAIDLTFDGRSLAVHGARAGARRIPVRMIDLPGAALDIDDAQDLADFISCDSRTLSAAYLRSIAGPIGMPPQTSMISQPEAAP